MVLTMSIPGRRVAPAPISDHRTIPKASATALRTLARSIVSPAAVVFASAPEPALPSFCARALWKAIPTAAATVKICKIAILFGMPSPQKVLLLTRSCLVVFFGDGVSQISFAAWQRFRQHGVGLGIKQRHPRSRGPGFQQYVRIVHRRRPGERIPVAVEAFDHVHVLTVEVAPDLIKPGAAIESPGVHHQSVPLPVSDPFSGVSPVQILQRGVLAAIRRN